MKPPLFTFLILLLATPAYAICIRTEYQPVAWNKSGNAFFMQKVMHGPEGGGAVAAKIVRFHGKDAKEFVFSSDYSPGDGSTPERISMKECRSTVKSANARLKSIGIANRVQDNCATSRDSFIKDEEPSLLLPDKAAEIAKALSWDPQKTVVASLDQTRFVLIEGNGTCQARCLRAVKKKNQILASESCN